MGVERGDEAGLWAAALAGDDAAFAVLFDRHHGRVFRHVAGLLDERCDADDLASATFLELWRRRNAVRLVGGSVLPWLLVTAGNLARNRYRVFLEELPRRNAAVDPVDEVERRTEVRERSRRLRAAMERLRPIDAQLIALTTLGGCTPGEAGEALGLNAGAARVRLHRARVRLRDLAEDPSDDLAQERS